MTGFGQDQTASVAATSRARTSRQSQAVGGAASDKVIAGAERPTGAGDDDHPDVSRRGRGHRIGQASRSSALMALSLEAVEDQPDAPRRRLDEQDRFGLGHAGRPPAGANPRT